MSKKEKPFDFTETRMVTKTRKEEYIDVDEQLVEYEQRTDLIRMDMNTIELPIFSKSSKKKKNEIVVYYLKTDKSAYLEIEPANTYAIPGEFEERVFIALTKIMRNNNYGREFYTTSSEIIENLCVERNSAYFERIKHAMKTLANTIYRFKSCLYSYDKKSVIDDQIHTTMMNIRIITRTDRESSNVEYFEDGRVKEVYKVSFSDHFYNNIITKGYLIYDSNTLLSIKSSVTRALYIMLEKLRHYNLYIRKPSFFIARRIPLKWDKKNLARTINILKKTADELIELGLIKNYKFIKGQKLELSEFEFYFEEEHNKIKRNNFYDEKAVIDLNFEITAQETKALNYKLNPDEEDIEKIFNIIPGARRYSTMKKIINDTITYRGLEYAIYTAKKIAKAKPKSERAYFLRLVNNNPEFDKEFNEYLKEKLKKQERKINRIQETEIQEDEMINEKDERDTIWEKFKKLEIEVQEKISDDMKNSLKPAEKDIYKKAIQFSNEESINKAYILKYISENNIDLDELSKKETEEVSIVNEPVLEKTMKKQTDSDKTNLDLIYENLDDEMKEMVKEMAIKLMKKDDAYMEMFVEKLFKLKYKHKAIEKLIELEIIS